jgi:predicted dehydrogenase
MRSMILPAGRATPPPIAGCWASVDRNRLNARNTVLSTKDRRSHEPAVSPRRTIMSNQGSGMDKRIRLGMVGGGQGAFIGAVHRIAARLDDHYTLVAGALSSEPERARASALEIGIAPDRAYASFAEMFEKEAARPDRIDAVAIVTPNHMHFPVAKLALESGFHVICDKPLTTTAADALVLARLAKQTGLIFCVTHNYTGYPLMRQARAMIAEGALGDIRNVQVEYAQSWLAEPLEETGQKQAAWRTDPAQSGPGGCIGDIGTHAMNLAVFATGLKPLRLLADLQTFIPGRRLDDNVQILLRFEGGASGTLWASQIAIGNENALRLRIYGSRGALEWEQENPNVMWYTTSDGTKRRLTRAGTGANEAAARVTRIPGGHPEGYLEAFATLYSEAARAITAHKHAQTLDPAVVFPTVDDGLAGVRFIEAAVKSSGGGNIWVDL